jgi:3-methyladenine DNA glycosylase/8-oxoguanine DNA glycosylase
MNQKSHGRLSSPRAETRCIQIPFKPPYDWEMLIQFLQPRATPGLEVVTRESYKRVFRIGRYNGTLEVRPSATADCLLLLLPSGDRQHLNRLGAKISLLFDCAVDPVPIAKHLSKQPLLTSLVALHPGIRVPGAFDAFEIAVRAVLGQQVTVRAATTISGRLVAAFGTRMAKPASDGLTHLFPRPSILARADLTRIGLTRAKAAAIVGLARRYLSHPSLLEPSNDPAAAISGLVQIPGIGEWTAQYIAMRALKHPDAFPASDLGLRRAISTAGSIAGPEQVEQQAESWRPWRAYAAMHLWASLV